MNRLVVLGLFAITILSCSETSRQELPTYQHDSYFTRNELFEDQRNDSLLNRVLSNILDELAEPILYHQRGDQIPKIRLTVLPALRNPYCITLHANNEIYISLSELRIRLREDDDSLRLRRLAVAFKGKDESVIARFDSLINLVRMSGMYDWDNESDVIVGDGTTCVIESQLEGKRKVIVRMLDRPAGYSNWDSFAEIEKRIRSFVPDSLRHVTFISRSKIVTTE